MKARDESARTAAPIRFAPAQVDLERRGDGSLLLRSTATLEPYARCAGEWLRAWSKKEPSRLLLAERAGGGWRSVSYAQAFDAARAIGSALLDRGLSPGHVLVVLSDNSVDHALLALGAMYVGVPYAPLSPAYSLMSSDHARLKRVFELLRPALVYADDAAPFAGALAAVESTGFELVASRNVPRGATRFDQLLARRPDSRADAAFEKVEPDAVAKLLLTSGSTGEAKAVINTHRMLCSNQQAIRQVWPFLADEPPVLVDWLPWSHTFGGNHNFNMVLANGGSMYVDEGKPAPGQVERSVANLRRIAPTLYFNVPRGFAALLDHLEGDDQLAGKFFSRLRLVFYAAAALPQNLWERLERLAERRGKAVAMASAWGATETAPAVTVVHWPIHRAGVIGLPLPGCELLMVPNGDKLEARVRGPNVTPGYWQRPDLGAAAFDEDGFYRTGDAMRLADPADAAKGLEFDGRLAEDFKLSTGTWVHVGVLRVRAIAALAPIAQDVVIAGHDRDSVGFLVFPDLSACRGLCTGLAADAPIQALLAHPRLRERVRIGMRELERTSSGSSTHATRALLMSEPPSIDDNEITDKGYINQRAVLARRAELVELLYRTPAHPLAVEL